MYSGTHENQGNQNTYVMHHKTMSLLQSPHESLDQWKI